MAMNGVRNTWVGLASALAVLAFASAAVSSAAESGGVGPGGGDGAAGDDGGGGGDGARCQTIPFGERTLERGDCGSDVETLNWLLRSREYGVALDPSFEATTHESVRDFQRRRGFAQTGVVNRETRRKLVDTMGRQTASWYGPGFFGNQTACGQTFRRDTKGVAHRTLPCGTKLVIAYGGRFARTRVIDRGPFVKRRYERDWDLSQALASKLHFDGVDRIRTAPIR